MPISVIQFHRGISLVNSIYLDSNVLIFARDRKSVKYRQASTILGELFSQNVQIYISDLVVDEFWYNLLGAWYKNDTGNALQPHLIKQDPSILPSYYRKFKINTTKIFKFPNLNIVPLNSISTTRIQRALELLTSNNNLLPRDTFHLTLVNLYNIEGFITSDSDFDSINIPFNFTLYKY